MDDSDSPASSLQIEPQDGCHLGDSAERRVTPLPSASDENENQLDGDGPAALTGSGSAMGRATVFDQDSLNNNESCLSSCEVAPGETAEHTPYEGPKDDQSSLGQDKKTPGKRSPRAKRGTPKNVPPGKAFILLSSKKINISTCSSSFHLVCSSICRSHCVLLYKVTVCS